MSSNQSPARAPPAHPNQSPQRLSPFKHAQQRRSPSPGPSSSPARPELGSPFRERKASDEGPEMGSPSPCARPRGRSRRNGKENTHGESKSGGAGGGGGGGGGRGSFGGAGLPPFHDASDYGAASSSSASPFSSSSSSPSSSSSSPLSDVDAWEAHDMLCCKSLARCHLHALAMKKLKALARYANLRDVRSLSRGEIVDRLWAWRQQGLLLRRPSSVPQMDHARFDRE